jgi:cell division protein FtsW
MSAYSYSERLGVRLVLIAAILIFGIGLLMIFSTTSAEVLDHALDKSTHQAFLKQLLYAGLGLLLGFTTWKFGYRKVISYSPVILTVLTVMLVLVLIPGVGREVNGSKRWLNLFGLSLQPSEFVKYVIPGYVIHSFLSKDLNLLEWKEFLTILGKICIPMVLIMIEPNNGTCAVIGAAVLAVFLLMQVPARFWATPLLVMMLFGVLFASQLPYIKGRVNVYLHPELDLKGRGHQPYQAKIAAGSGGIFGRGPGNSLQKMSYLPEAQNDYIAAIYGEEFGFLGIIALISLYLILGLGGFSIALASNEAAGLYYGGAILFLICLQAFLNMGVVSGLLPSTGLNLPLFSQGGSSLMANMAAIGLLLSVGRGRKAYA